jgi:hypothetical protein
MLTDGLKSKNVEQEVKQLDVAELLEQSCAPLTAASPPVVAPAGDRLAAVAP